MEVKKKEKNQQYEIEERGDELRRSQIKETNWKPQSSNRQQEQYLKNLLGLGWFDHQTATRAQLRFLGFLLSMYSHTTSANTVAIPVYSSCLLSPFPPLFPPPN
jgi:hypothetical protein